MSTRHGEHADTLTLFNNSWRGPVRIPLLGFVPFPEVLPDMQHGDFGSVAKNDTARLVFRFANPSISLLRVDSVRTRTRFFRLSRPKLPFYVQTGDSLVVTVAFVPDSIRHFSDTLTIVSNAASSPDRIPLWGDDDLRAHVGGRVDCRGHLNSFPTFRTRSTHQPRFVMPYRSRATSGWNFSRPWGRRWQSLRMQIGLRVSTTCTGRPM